MKKHAANFLLLACALLVALLVSEMALRVFKPNEIFGLAIRDPSIKRPEMFMLDEELGYMPILGNKYYSLYGTKANAYGLEKRLGVKRILFIGDSVTARGKIIDSLKNIYGEEKFEFWNAGVEGFNTIQEAKFYKRYNAVLNPDQVVLTFHLNDFTTTAVVFKDSHNNLVVYSPVFSKRFISKPLFPSYLYRFLVTRILELCPYSKVAIFDEVKSSLKELNSELQAQNIRFSVLIFPALKPYEDWLSGERVARGKIIGILQELGIEYYDLLPIVQSLAKKGSVLSERHEDWLHPSDTLASAMAEYLSQRKIF